MKKKETSVSGLDAILGSFAQNPVPSGEGSAVSPASSEGAEKETPEESRRRGRPVGTTKSDVLRRPFSMKMQDAHYEKLSAVAYWDRMSKQDVMDMALDEFFAAYEKKNGVIKPAK